MVEVGGNIQELTKEVFTPLLKAQVEWNQSVIFTTSGEIIAENNTALSKEEIR